MKKKNLVFFAAVILCASLMCIWMNQFNNKYTDTAAQPVNGFLMLSEEELSLHPLRFLTEEWAFYPDVLLSPEDFQEGAPMQYMTYTNIGQYTCFCTPSDPNQPHGCGTWVLYLTIPDTSVTLELPEIFSAYRLYVNDDLVLQLGNPEPDAYRPLVQNRSIDLAPSSGTVRLILAVSDYSHYYSGLVYPPALGTSQAIREYQAIRLMVCTSGISIAFLLALLSLYLGLRMKHRNALYFSLLCFAMVGFTSYPLVHTLMALPAFPWYIPELCCGYLVLFLIVLLHNRICGTGALPSAISQWTAFFFLLASLVYGLSAPVLTVPAMQAYSAALSVYKAAAAGYLLCSSAAALCLKEPSALLVFYGDVFYGTVLFWDRLFPDYEPIYGGWFSEWGDIVLILTILYTLWSDMAQAYSFRVAFSEEKKNLERQLAIQQEHYQELNEKIKEAAKMHHDERHHLITISNLLENNKLNELRQYLAEYRFSYGQQEHTVLCGNLTVDAILQYYRKRCLASGICISIQAQLPPKISISDTDLAILYGNLIENALEACLKQGEGNRFIDILTSFQDGKLLLRVENSFGTPPRKKDEKFLSTKHRGYGIGTESVKTIIRRCHGQIKYDITEECFRVSVVLSL